MIICMIPARLGSQRLKQKNLLRIHNYTLVEFAVKRALKSGCFDQVWVNSESSKIGEVALMSGAQFHLRPQSLGSNSATSEDFIAEFLSKHHCKYIVQLHTIAPLLTPEEISLFVNHFLDSECDSMFSTELIKLETLFQSQPVNFSYNEKTNSQDLLPLERITWSISAWTSESYLNAYHNSDCATYSGRIQTFSLSSMASHVIKTESDLSIANALYPLAYPDLII